jgi:branched-chain amino acid transport system substrate-binding protein
MNLSTKAAITKTMAVIIVLLIVVIAGVGAGIYYSTLPTSMTQTTQVTSAAQTTAQTTAPYTGPTAIKIGMTMPLSGSLAADGVMSLDGLQMWASNVNATGGIYVSSLGRKLPVQLIVYDDTSSTAVVATDYQTLVTQGVQFLIAPYSSGLTLAAAPIAETNHIILMSHGGASDSIFQKGYKYVVQVLSPGSAYMIPVLGMLKNQNSTTPIKVAFFFGNDAFSISVRQGASAYLNSTTGFNLVYNQLYDESATSYTAQLTQITAANPDVILGGAHFADGETIMKNIQSLGLHFKMVSLLVAPDDPHFLTDLGSLANNVVAPSQWEQNLYGPQQLLAANVPLSAFYGNITGPQFFSQFQSRFNMPPNYEAAEAYNTGLVLQKSISDSGSLNSDGVRAQMGKEDFYSFYGRFVIDSTGLQTGHTMVVMQWQNGVKQTIWPKPVATAKFVYPM